MMFLKINGGNGATFFFSAASFADWRKSLEFYQGVSWLAKVKKTLLLVAYPVLKCRAAMTSDEVAAALREIVPADIALGMHDSAMISPTRDKVILHHHGKSYKKFAVGASRAGVSRELEWYRLLAAKQPETFVVSPLLEGSENDTLVHFTMGYAPKVKGQGGELPLAALAEFFNLKREPDASWNSCWNRLELPFEIPATDRDGVTPVGAVHRDFKPWNVRSGRVPQIFDFESVAAGLPLEDFFNYFVDPALHFGSVRKCQRILEERKVFASARRLLALQGIAPAEFDRYWKWYLCERYDFFVHSGNQALAEKFLALYGQPVDAACPVWKCVIDVGAIAVFAALVRSWYAWHHPLEANDGIGYLTVIRRWVETNDWHVLSSHPPLFFYLTKLLAECGLPVADAALAVNLIAGSCLVIPVYLTARAVWRKHSSGIAAALFCAVMPKLVKFSCLRIRDSLYLFFAGWCIAFLALSFRAEKRGKTMLFSFLCGFAIAGGGMCRYEMLEFLPWACLTLPVLALYFRRNWRDVLWLPLMVLLGGAVGVAALSLLPGMPPVWQSYRNRIQLQFWSWRIWGLR